MKRKIPILALLATLLAAPATATATEYEWVYEIQNGKISEFRQVEIRDDIQIYSLRDRTRRVSLRGLQTRKKPRASSPEPETNRSQKLVENFLKTARIEQQKQNPDYVQIWTNCQTSILISIQNQRVPTQEAFRCRENSSREITSEQMLEAYEVSKKLVDTLLPEG